MTGATRWTRPLILFTILFTACIAVSGCLGTGGGAGGPPSPGVTTQAGTPVPVHLTTPRTVPASPIEPIVGTWYAPVPDDLTFEFHGDGTFTERSPNFPTYQGTWTRSEEYFYDAFILDRWGYRKPAKLLYATGSLMTKGIGTMHRTG